MDGGNYLITMNTIIIAIIGSGALTALITNIFNLIGANSRQKRVNQILLLGEMERRLENYRKRASITQEQLQIFISIGELYHEEGGNGYAEALLSEARSMPHA